MKNSNTALRLKQIMSERNLKQVDILRLTEPYCKIHNVKMNKSDISQYCSGKTEPNQDKLYVLSEALNVNEAWLMGYDAQMDREDPNILRFDKASDSALTLLENWGYTVVFSDSYYDDSIIIKKGQDIIKTLSESALVRNYEYLQTRHIKPTLENLLCIHQDNLSSRETSLLYVFNSLNNTGQEKVLEYASDLSHNSSYLAEQSSPYSVHTLAAHAHPDATEEEKQKDYDMMNDPSIWGDKA